MVRNTFRLALVAAAVAASAVASTLAHAAWEPTKPVEFIVPAGTGGGADQMARFIQGVVAKNNLMKQPLVVVNKSGGAGAEGFLEVKGAKGDANKIIITLSNLFTTPLATGVPFNWKDLTPVAMLALDEFVLWVNAESPYKTATEYITAVKGGDAGKFKMAGTGSKQEDQIITVALEKVVGKKLTYIPFKGGGDVAVQLVGKHVDSTGEQPDRGGRALASRRAASRCACSTASRWPIPPRSLRRNRGRTSRPCKTQGLAVEYLMLRGIFMPPGVTQEQVDFYIDLFKRVRNTPDWKKFTEDAAFKDTFMTGKEYVEWVSQAETTHKQLMQEAGFIAK